MSSKKQDIQNKRKKDDVCLGDKRFTTSALSQVLAGFGSHIDLRFHKKCLISYSWSLFVFVTSNVLYFWPLAFCIFDHQPFCISNQQHFVFVTSSISWFHLKPVLLGPFQTLHEDGYKTSIVGSCLIFVSMNDSNMFSKLIFAGPNYYRRYWKVIQIICPPN